MTKSANGWTLLHVAAQAEDKSLVELVMNLIGRGRTAMLLSAEDKTGRRPLHIAAYKDGEDVVELLTAKMAELKVDMSKKDSAGNNAAALAKKTNRRRSREIIQTYTGETDK